MTKLQKPILSERVINFLLVISIFFNSYVITKSPAEIYFSYIPIALLLPVFLMKYGVSRIIFKIFLPLFFMGVIYIQLGENTWGQFLKISIGFFTSVLFFQLIIEHYKFNLERLFKIYMYACYIFAIIGVVQLIAFHLGIVPLYRFNWILNKWALSRGGLGLRINSIFSEPSYVAASVAPAMFVSLYNITNNSSLFLTKKKSIVIVLLYFLSFSSLGILAFVVALIFLLVRRGFITAAVFVGPVTVLVFFIAYQTIGEFKERVDGTVEIFSSQNIYSYDIHGSSFVLYNNYHVATTNFLKNPLFGSGLGSHVIAFDKYSLTNQIGVVDIEFNSADANSMFLRLLSETGIFGVGFFMFFLIKNYTPRKRALNEEYWLISVGCFIIIIVHLVRQGHYFYNGFPFFMWLYYYTSKISKEKLNLANEQ
tara:strand:+ start:19459 stop:20730 length:1272 start_codon:yes stop_codon:yes gene_type:complete